MPANAASTVCINCGHPKAAIARFCSFCGNTGSPQETALAEPLFLYIPVARFICLSLVTFHLYSFYWIYKNWAYLNGRNKMGIRPFWRTFFGVFYCHSLLREIHEDPEARAVLPPTFSPNVLATGWVILTLLSNAVSRLPGDAGILALVIPAFLFLMPVQSYVNKVTKLRNPSQSYYHWSIGQVICLIVGLLFCALVLAGIFLPQAPSA